MKRILFLLAFLFSLSLHAQKKDTAYFVQFIDQRTKEEIPFVNVQAFSNGVQFAAWTGDLDGIIKIKRTEISDQTNIQFKAIYVGYQPQVFNLEMLGPNDTTVIQMNNPGFQLNEIVVVDYVEPLIDPEPTPRNKKHHSKKQDTVQTKPVSIYTPKQLADFDSLKNGKWIVADSSRSKEAVSSNDFFKILSHRFHYPPQAKENHISGTVYMQFTIDQNGYIQKITCLKGDPILALEVAHVLMSMPRLVVDHYYTDGGIEQKVFEPVTYLLPVKFSLQ